MSIYPEQKLPASKKDAAWSKANIDYFIEQASFDSGVYAEIFTLFRAAEGKLNKADYNYILNPYGVEEESMKKYPSRLRNYDIIGAAIQLFLGERTKRPNDDQVIALNSDSQNRFTEGLQFEVKKALAQIAVNAMNDAGIPTGVDSQEVPPIETIKQKYNASWVDERAIIGQEALDYIIANCDMDDKLQLAYYHWLVCGRCITYKEPLFDEVNYEVVHPLDFWCFKSEQSPFIEDSLAAVRRSRMGINEILDIHRRNLKLKGKDGDDDISKLEKLAGEVLSTPNTSGYVHLPSANMDSVSVNYGLYKGGTVNRYHVVWKSFKQVFILKYQNAIGEVVEMEVDETYKLDVSKGDISLEEDWISEVMHGYRFAGDTDGIYIHAEPFPVQRDELNNSSKNKLPFGGRYEIGVTGDIISVTKTGLVYQALHNVYHYKREMTINRNKDKIMMMPIGVLPKEFGKDKMKKFMYMMEATSIGWFDETKPNANAALSAMKSIDMGLYQYIEGMTRVIEGVKGEFWDAIGMNRQRYGDTQSSDGKAVNEQAIFRSAIISAERNRKFEKAREKDMNGLLDTSKVAYINGKKAPYITSDRRRAFLDINGAAHMETDYGVFSRNSEKEQEKLEHMKQVTFAMAQKGTGKAGMVAEVLDANNFSKVKEIAKYADMLEETRMAQEEQANRDSNEQVAKINAQVQTDKNDTAKYTADRHYDAVVKAAEIAAAAKVETSSDNDSTPEVTEDTDKTAIELEKLGQKREEAHMKDRTANRKITVDAQLGEKKVEVDKIKAKAAARKKPASK